MIIKRTISPIILDGAKHMPVIAIIGPRQSGKSTLAHELFPNYEFVDMQDADLFEFANSDAKGFLSSYENKFGIIIDEAQYAPKLFPQIKVEVDKNRRAGNERLGYYILSGSQNFLLHEQISESLAGRVYFYRLLPFSIEELKSAGLLEDKIEDQIIKGFYPRAYQIPNVQEYYDSYILTYVERDIRSIKNIENISLFKKFMQLCALRVGSMLNITDLATSTGISVNTARSWLSLLETSFVLFLLPSYHNNLGKRIIKSPKLYFYDVGLAASLMGIDKEVLIKKRDIYGALFENMIIVDTMKNLNGLNFRYSLSFYRDSNQNEIDLIVETRGRIIPIEIKASESISNKFFETLTWFRQNADHIEQPILIYGGSKEHVRNNIKVIPWDNTIKIFTDEK